MNKKLLLITCFLFLFSTTVLAFFHVGDTIIILDRNVTQIVGDSNGVSDSVFNAAFPVSFDTNVVFDSNVVLDGRYVRLDDLNNQTVSQILAGTNITISPLNGIGVVTINSSGGGALNDLNWVSFNQFFNPSGSGVPDANILNATRFLQDASCDNNSVCTFTGSLNSVDANNLYVKLNPTVGQVISDAFDLNHLDGHTFLGHTFIFGDDPDDELLVIRQAAGATDHILTVERNDTSHLFTILPNGQVDVNIVADEDGQMGIHLHTDTNGFSQIVPLEINHVIDSLGAEEEAHSILIALDQSAVTTGEVTGLEIIPTQGGARVIGLSTTALVSPIHQLSGVFSDMDSASVAGVDRLAEFISTGSDIAMFVNDDDNVVIGNSVQFSEIEFLLATEASGSGIKPTFEHSTGVSTFTTFVPTDTTKGMRENGVIVFDLDLIAGDWATGAGGEFLIRITRTANVLMTVPVESLVQIAVTQEFSWDQFGDLNVHDANVQRHLVVDQNINWGSLTYAPPIVRGSSGQFLTEDGFGNLSYTTGFTEADANAIFVSSIVFSSAFNSDFNVNNVDRLLQNSVYSPGASLTLDDQNRFNVDDANLFSVLDFVKSSIFNSAFNIDFNVNNVTRLLQDSNCDNNINCTIIPGSISDLNGDLDTRYVRFNPVQGQVIAGDFDLNHIDGNTFLGPTIFSGDVNINDGDLNVNGNRFNLVSADDPIFTVMDTTNGVRTVFQSQNVLAIIGTDSPHLFIGATASALAWTTDATQQFVFGGLTAQEKVQVLGDMLINESITTYDAPGTSPFLHIFQNQVGDPINPSGELILGHISDGNVGDILGEISFYSSDASSTATGKQVILRAINEDAAGRRSRYAIFTGTGADAIERATYTGTGDYGLGTSTPSAMFDLNGGAGRGILEIDGDTGGCLKLQDTDNAGFTFCTSLNGILFCSMSAC